MHTRLHRVRLAAAAVTLTGSVVLLVVTAAGWVHHRDPWTAVAAALILGLQSVDTLVDAWEAREDG